MAQRRRHSWEKLSDAELLDWRIKDLDLRIEGTWLEPLIERIYRGFELRGIPFRPHFWLSDEFFCPSGVPGVAIPFYLAHPRLRRLENNQMFEVEGGNEVWCMKILRHEVGHAIEHAYRLHCRRDRQRMFGRTTMKYPTYYSPRPYSKSFVIHLDYWYAQSHPDEDFAETFAVWFAHGPWRKRYRGWPALRKLEYVDRLMRELKGKCPPVRSRLTVDPIAKLGKTLREHYEEKKKRYGVTYPDFYDRDLRRLFSDAPEFRRRKLASRFLRGVRKEARRKIAYWTGEYQYTIDKVIQEMIRRCDELELRLMHEEETTLSEYLVLLSVQTMNYLHGGHHKLAL